jgi:hypothetical protein
MKVTDKQMHYYRKVSLICVLCVGIRAFCQTPHINAVSGVPTEVLYHFFFQQVMFLQDQAGKLQAQGKDGSRLGNLIQKQAGLTSQQASTLVAIASDWRTGEAAIHAQIRQVAATGARLSASPQWQALEDQSRQSLLSHLSQLQTALGPGASYVLDLYVRRTSNVSGPGVTPASY